MTYSAVASDATARAAARGAVGRPAVQRATAHHHDLVGVRLVDDAPQDAAQSVGPVGGSVVREGVPERLGHVVVVRDEVVHEGGTPGLGRAGEHRPDGVEHDVDQAVVRGGQFATPLELVAPEGADGIEESIAARHGTGVDRDQGSIDELVEVGHERVSVNAHQRRCSFGGERAGEDGELVEETRLVVGQEVARPPDRVGDAAVAGLTSKPWPVEHVDRVAETIDDLADRHRPGPGSGDLDRERQTVEPPAQLRDDFDVVFREATPGVGGPLQEELDRWAFGRLAVEDGQGERSE